MGNTGRPKRASAQYRPRKRFFGQIPKIQNWNDDKNYLLKGFYGFKVGMMNYQHEKLVDENLIFHTSPLTVLECPPILFKKLYGYKKSHKGLVRTPLEDLSQFTNEITEVRGEVQVTKPFTSKQTTSLTFELGLNITNENISEIFEKIKNKTLFEITNEIFDLNSYVDIISLTKGKGFQGRIKRLGVSRLSHKNSKKRRAVATQGTKRPGFTRPTVGARGQFGYFQRTIFNNKIIDSLTPEQLTKIFPSYGQIKTKAILVHGSIPGPAKRLVILRNSQRKKISLKQNYTLI
jgi:large subunit ribosomal protein L3